MPSSVKTDNSPAYISQKMWQFLQLWGVMHKLGVSRSPTGQAITTHAHGYLKCVLEKQKGGMTGETAQSRLAKALHTINHLTVPPNSNNPGFLNRFFALQSTGKTHLPRAKVWVRDLLTNKWEGPWDLITWGRGYACVSTDTGMRWIPARCVRPDSRHQKHHETNRQPSEDDDDVGHLLDGPTSG